MYISVNDNLCICEIPTEHKSLNLHVNQQKVHEQIILKETWI